MRPVVQAQPPDPAMVAILERLIQARQDELQRQQLEFQRQQFEMQRQQAATQQQYLELLRHLVIVGVSPPPSVLTLALQSSGPQSQGQYTSPQQQVSQTFQSPSYTPIQMGFTPPAQPRPHLLLGTPFTDLSATYSECHLQRADWTAVTLVHHC
jgi:hypothetical protein